MKTEKLMQFFLIILFSCCLGNVWAQDYSISFAGSGATTIVTSVKVENLTQGTSLTMSGTDVLHLVNSTTGAEPIIQDQFRQITFAPNPMAGFSRMQFYLPEAGKTIIGLYDISGREILHSKDLLPRGLQTYKIQGIKNGIYFVTIKSNKYVLSGTLVCANSTNNSAKIKYENSVLDRDPYEAPLLAQKELNISKGTKAEVIMQYNTGDRLKLTGISGNNSAVITDIPLVSKNITFNFTACTDGNANNYPVVQIGSQTWMAENLKATRYRDGINVSNITDNSAWSSFTYGAYCWLNNAEVNKDTYGALYNWKAVDTRKLCPKGWHVPSDEEWTTLTTFLGGLDNAGGKLKETGTTHWNNPNAESTNETGFTSLPGGYRHPDFINFGKQGYWWTATDAGSSTACMRWMEYSSSRVGRLDAVKTDGNSVRCVKDRDNANPPAGDYVANTDFGKFTLTVDASGFEVTKIAYQFSNYKCGPVTISGGITITQNPPWQITNGSILIANILDTYGKHMMIITGVYDPPARKFSGYWTDNSYGSVCSGKWEAPAP